MHAAPSCAHRVANRVHMVWHMRARSTRSTRSLHRPGCCLQPAVVESADARINTIIEPLPQPAAPPLPAPPTSAFLWYWNRRPLHGPKRFRGVPVLIEHDTPDGRGRRRSTPVSSRPELASVGCGIPSGMKGSIELSMCPFFRCAGHFWPSDQSWPARAREQEQRVVDPSSQPPASCRSIRAWWPDE